MVFFFSDLGPGSIFQGFQATLSNLWVGSSLVWVSVVSIPASRSVSFDLRLNCDDTDIAQPLLSLIDEERSTGGAIGPVVPFWSVIEADDDGQGPSYGMITNGGTQEAFVTIGSSVRGEGAGNTSCTLRIGQEKQTFSVNFEPLVDLVTL